MRFFLLLAVLAAAPAAAHEVRPGYLEITETARDAFAVVWKQPVRGGRTQLLGLGLRPIFPENCTRESDSRLSRTASVLVERFELACAGGLAGRRIGVEGLRKTITDVFVRLEAQDGKAHLRLTPAAPFARLSGGGIAVAGYFALGVEHLVFGLDHILFVLGLVLLVASKWRLLWVITGFTLAHSLTLGLAVFGLVALPSAPVEAAIALSILFVAVELSRPEATRSATARHYPQAIAFAFGLLHGFGFAGALAEIGLPRGDALWALGLFNLGLEAGQLGIVALALALGKVLAQPAARYPTLAALPVWAMGAVAVYWLAARTLAIIQPV